MSEENEEDTEGVSEEEGTSILRSLKILDRNLELFFKPMKSAIRSSSVRKKLVPILNTVLSSIKFGPVKTAQDAKDQHMMAVLFLLYKHLKNTLE